MKSNRQKFWLSLYLAANLLLGAAQPVRPQTRLPAAGGKSSKAAGSRDQAHARLLNLARGADFGEFAVKTVGVGDLGGLQNWLDANNADFFRAMDTAFRKGSEEIPEQKTKQNESLNGEPLKPAALPPARKMPAARQTSFDPRENVFRRASFEKKTLENSADDDRRRREAPDESDGIMVTKSETDGGITVKGSLERISTQGDVTVTQGETGEGRAIMENGGSIGMESRSVQFVNLENKKARRSLRTETTLSLRTTVASCPDADGVSAGTATYKIVVKKTLTTPQTIAVLTRDLTTTIKLTGRADDDAELTHYDMEADTTETLSGYGRAKRLGLIEDTSFDDGARQMTYGVGGNKLTYKNTGEPGGPTGGTMSDGEMGKVDVKSATDGMSEAEMKRVDEFAAHALETIWREANTYYGAAELHWQGNGCVEVKLTAPKTKLKPGEEVEVTAETVHLHDKTKVKAKLIVTISNEAVTPESQMAEPAARFTLTAPKPKGEGMFDNAIIGVDSVSKRGKGEVMMEFGQDKEKKKPPREPRPAPAAPPKFDPGEWSGTITYKRVQTFTDTRTVPRVSGRGEDTRESKIDWIYTATVTVTPDAARPGSLKGVAAIGSVLTSTEKRTGRERNSCDRGRTWREMSGVFTTDMKTTGDEAAAPASVSLGTGGADGSYSVGISLPPVRGRGEGTQTSSYSNQCVAKEGKTVTIPPTEVEVQGNSITTDGSHRLDPANPNVLSDTYTRTSENITETITWNLHRKGGARPGVKTKLRSSLDLFDRQKWLEIFYDLNWNSGASAIAGRVSALRDGRSE